MSGSSPSWPRLLSGPEPLAGLGLLDRFEATAVVLPEVAALRGVGQSANHHLDAHAHTLEVLRRMLCRSSTTCRSTVATRRTLSPACSRSRSPTS